MTQIYFPMLATAARRLHLGTMEEGAIAECALCAMDAGFCEGRATMMALQDFLQRRGLYEGALKKAVEDGTIFSMAEGEHDGRRNQRDSRRAVSRGRGRVASGSVAAGA